MAQEHKTNTGWLERRRATKREKVQRRARRAAEQRAEQAAAAERATRGWRPSRG